MKKKPINMTVTSARVYHITESIYSISSLLSLLYSFPTCTYIKWLIITYNNHSYNDLECLEDQEEVEDIAVALAYTVPEPGTVMVEGGDAVITVLAMFAPQWLLYVAYCAVLALNKEHDLIFFIISLVLLAIASCCCSRICNCFGAFLSGRYRFFI